MHEFDPDQHDVIFALVPLSGFGPDSMVTIEEDGPGYTYVKGVDGQVTRSKVLGQTALVTVTLMSSSQSNAVLSGIYTLGRDSAGGADVSPIMVRDRNGVSVFASDKAWIEGMPTVSRGPQAGPLEWKIRVVDYKFFEGGSAPI